MRNSLAHAEGSAYRQDEGRTAHSVCVESGVSAIWSKEGGRKGKKITAARLYLAIGIPSELFVLTSLAIIWQSRGVPCSIDSFQKVMVASRAGAPSRLKHLEEREH